MKFLHLAVCLSLCGVANAQTSTASADPADISRFKDIATGASLPSGAQVTNLQRSAEALVKAGKCKEAIPALDTWAKQANLMSNILTAGLTPFYNSDPDGRRAVASLDELTMIEGEVNFYKNERNIAIVTKAECLVKLGKKNEAAAYFMRALDLIPVFDDGLWARAMKGLYALIDVKSPL